MGPDGDPDADDPRTPVDESRDGISLTPPPYTDALDLTDMDTGEYTFRVKTVKATCNLLDIESSEYSFTVRSEELEIEAVDKTVGKGEDMSVKSSWNPNDWYYLIVTGVSDAQENLQKYQK
ncbi:MAG: hypothetical protein MW690_000277 [Methanophagales archaeon]|nr:hypothetical protein [Methanophagales archaeon]MCU4140346.1 hypothetical protein [Methanophagales archaeon]